MTEKTIKILGKDVDMIYCNATEDGFEEISPRPISVFVPTVSKDEKGEETIIPAQANISDYVRLAFASIVAASTKKGEKQPPINGDDIMYNISPVERNMLIEAIVEIRNEWYEIPKIVEEQLKKEAEEQPADDQPKNA